MAFAWFTAFSLLIGYGFSAHLPEENMNAMQLIQNQGYPAEEYEVVTEDGYILGVQRIPRGVHGPYANNSYRPAVLLVHGLGGSSTNWLDNLWNESLAFILADAGFDVWLGNCRGDVYSQKHVSLSPKQKQFWDFTWQDMAAKDVPAMVNYVLAVTDQSQLFYVGHSQGTLIGFGSFSTDLEFAKKIRTFFALAPVSTVGYITSPVKALAPFTAEILALSNMAGIRQTGSLEWILDFLKPICDVPVAEKLLCENILFYMLGAENVQYLNQTRIPVYIAQNPAGTSMKNVAHFGQMVNAKKMQMFDYGWAENLVKYHQLQPPQYYVEYMQTKTVLFWSNVDALADPRDVTLLLPKIQNKQDFLIDNYSHIDFIFALNAPKLIYEPMIRIMREELMHEA